MHLLKLQFKKTYALGHFFKKLKSSSRLKWITGIVVFAIIVNLPTLYYLIKGLDTVYEAFESLNQSPYFLAVGYIAISLIIFFFGIFMLIGNFYFSNDIETLLPLPIKSRNIILSKFFVLLSYEYLITAVFYFPITIIYGLNTAAGIVFYILCLINFFLLPVIPLGLAGVLVVILMRITNIKGRKDLFRGITMFIMIFLLVGVQLYFNKMLMSIEPGTEMDFLRNLLEDMYLVERMESFYPMIVWAIYSLVETGLKQIGYLLLYILSSGGILLIFTFITDKIYLGGLIGGKEKSASKKRMTIKQFENKTKQSKSKIISVFLTDFKTMLRTPIYFINCLSIAILIPVIFIMMGVGFGNNESFAGIMDLYNNNVAVFNLAIVGFFVFFASCTPITATTFSREGKTNWIFRIAPIDSNTQIIGRLLSSIMVQLFTIIFSLIGMSFIINLNIETIIIAIIFGLILVVPIQLIGLIIDLNRPMLKWDNQQQAVKQNLNVIFSMLIGMGYLTIFGVLTYQIFKITNELHIVLIIIGTLSLILTTILYKILSRSFEDKLIMMDE